MPTTCAHGKPTTGGEFTTDGRERKEQYELTEDISYRATGISRRGQYSREDRRKSSKISLDEKVGEHLPALSVVRPGWVPCVRETLFLVASLLPPSVGSPVAPDVYPERDDEHGCGGVVEDGAEDPVYAFIQGHGFHLLSRIFGLGLAALP